MIVARGIEEVKKKYPAPVVTIGNFDGIHLGHQKIFRNVSEAAKGSGTPVVITFHPHPVKVISPDRGLKLLTPLDEKIRLVEKMGIALFLCIDFDREFSKTDPDEFISDLLVNRLNVTHVIVGHNYRFGKGKNGTTDLLRRRGKRYGFRLNVVRNMKIAGQTVSSTRIRQLLSWGRVTEAAALLGRPYSIHGEVIRGAGRGASILDTPTANIDTPNELTPKEGVYAVRVKVEDQLHDGVANIGRNPTFGGEDMSYEVHLFGYRKNLLGRELKLYFIDRIRGEKRFSGASELKDQIERDITTAKMILMNDRYSG